MHVLFVCRGNVGRSVMAEALLLQKAPSPPTVSSAGTKLSGPEQPIGELAPAINEVLTAMKEIGIDVSGHVRRQVTPEMVASADVVILTIDDNDPVPEYLINNPKVVRWDVLDPKGKDIEFTRRTRNQISALIDVFIEEHKLL
ncbi:MAG: phosphotyrosine protein phosphatase [Candidatus Taylorbacteria bacterium]|nr:phosphotyrosine protein phosphatase [Candidatus Taylorbacteria bacterium]